MKVKLSDIGAFKNGLNFKKSPIINPCKYIGVADFKDNVIANTNNLKCVDESIVPNEFLLKRNDILFVRSNGNRELVGRTLIVPEIKEKVSFSGFCIRYRLKENIDINPLYLLYFFKSPTFKRICSRNQQTNINNLNQDLLGDIEISIPPRKEQDEIVRFLHNITMKISNNLLIIDKLEFMIKTIYNYWFLQFEFPNENGKPYKTSGGKMVWSEELKRDIPVIWTSDNLNTFANMYQPESFDAKKLIDTEKYPVYGAGGFMGYFNKYNHKNIETFISCRGSCGTVYRSLPYSLITGNAMIVHSKNEEYNDYLYWTLKEIGVQKCVTGSVQPQITRSTLGNWKLVKPDVDTIRKFNKIENIAKKQIVNNAMQNQQLSSLRDWLLPILMNGQVTFKDEE